MKLFKHTLLVALAALTLTATSCLDNKDDDEQTLESRPMMYYRIVDVNSANTTPYFYQSYGLLYFKSPAESFNAIQAIKLSDLVSLQFETGYLPLKSTGTNSIYTFSHSMIQTEGHQISALSGKVDYYGSIYMEFMVDGNYKVYATSTPLYNVTSTKVAASASDKPEYNTSNMYYGMLIDPTDHKAIPPDGHRHHAAERVGERPSHSRRLQSQRSRGHNHRPGPHNHRPPDAQRALCEFRR